MNILRHILAGVHAALVAACLYASVGSNDGLTLLAGVLLFGAMASTMWLQSRWVLLPGILLVLLFTAAALMMSLAVLWPIQEITKAVVTCSAMVAVEILSIVTTLLAPRIKSQPESVRIAGWWN